jgi:hypothetical protein
VEHAAPRGTMTDNAAVSESREMESFMVDEDRKY